MSLFDYILFSQQTKKDYILLCALRVKPLTRGQEGKFQIWRKEERNFPGTLDLSKRNIQENSAC